MENLLTSSSVQQRRRGTRKPKTKKKTKGIKVVYISNPMKVHTCASKFRALVQELTGQDAAAAGSPPDDVTCAADQTVLQDAANHHHHHNDAVHEVPLVDPSSFSHHHHRHRHRHQIQSSDFCFEQFEEDGIGMLDSFSGILPSTLFSESSQLDALRSLDAM